MIILEFHPLSQKHQHVSNRLKQAEFGHSLVTIWSLEDKPEIEITEDFIKIRDDVLIMWDVFGPNTDTDSEGCAKPRNTSTQEKPRCSRNSCGVEGRTEPKISPGELVDDCSLQAGRHTAILLAKSLEGKTGGAE